MFKVFNFASVTIAMMAIGVTAVVANPATQAKPKPSIVNSAEMNLGNPTKPMLPEINGKQVQRKQVMTTLTLTFETLADYEAFAPGKLTTNLILKNASSGQTKTIESIMMKENFSAAYRKAASQAKENKPYTMTIAIIIDDLMEPLMSAGKVELTGESRSDESGVNLILTYSGLGSRSAQVNSSIQPCGQPIKGITVKGGRNPGGNVVVNASSPQVVTSRSIEKLASNPEALILRSSQSNGTLKAQGF